MKPETTVLRLLDWARVWSPSAPVAERVASWAALGLGEPCVLWDHPFVAAFVVAAPVPRVPLLLHAALGRDGSAVREEWLRILAILDLEWHELRLPPDHLAVATELLAVAVAWCEVVLAFGILDRYLVPWANVAAERLDGEPLAALVAAYRSDLDAAATTIAVAAA